MGAGKCEIWREAGRLETQERFYIVVQIFSGVRNCFILGESVFFFPKAFN